LRNRAFGGGGKELTVEKVWLEEAAILQGTAQVTDQFAKLQTSLARAP
jgi:hypothetical protein